MRKIQDPLEKRTFLADRYEWQEGEFPHLENMGPVEVEVTVNWSHLASLAHRAVHAKRGCATAYHGAVEARVIKAKKS